MKNILLALACLDLCTSVRVEGAHKLFNQCQGRFGDFFGRTTPECRGKGRGRPI